MGTVAWISYTAVKGLGLQTVDEVDLTHAGVRGDRRFYLIDERGFLTNSKRTGALHQVKADWDEGAQRLTLTFPDGHTVSDVVRTDGALTTSFYGRPVEAHLVDGPFTDALSEFTGKQLRLAQTDVEGGGIDRGGDGVVTILSTGSLSRMAEAAGVKDVDARRFRMLFGVDGVDPHAEDAWIDQRVRIGDAIVRPRGHVGRCVITTRDPETGEQTLDTLKVLAGYRSDLDTTEPLPFGIYGQVLEPGRVRVGDPVAV
jgi:uncharacterized protein YcbX